MRIRAKDININCVIDGPDGAPWITFITGITNDVTMWDTHLPALARDYRLLRLDTRGHGHSDATPPPYSFPQLTADVISVWDALGIERTCLVGLGLGGMTATALALDAPDRITALIPSACRLELAPEYAAIWPPMLEKSSEGGIEAIIDVTMTRWFPDSFRRENPRIMEDVRRMMQRTSIEGYHGCIQALLSVDFGHRLGELAMPVLCVSGALDQIGAPSEVMDRMARTVRNGQHVSLPDAGHICTMANPREYERVVREFLSSI